MSFTISHPFCAKLHVIRIICLGGIMISDFDKEIFEQSIAKAENEGLEGLPDLFAFSLLKATYQYRAAEISPDLLRILSEIEGPDRVAQYAELIADPFQRAMAYRFIGGGGDSEALTYMPFETFHLKKIFGKLDSSYLNKSLLEAQLISDDDNRKDRFLNGLAIELAHAGEKESALKAAGIIQKTSTSFQGNIRDHTFSALSDIFIVKGFIPEAFTALEQIQEEYYKNSTLYDITKSLARFGKIEESFAYLDYLDQSHKWSKEFFKVTDRLCFEMISNQYGGDLVMFALKGKYSKKICDAVIVYIADTYVCERFQDLDLALYTLGLIQGEEIDAYLKSVVNDTYNRIIEVASTDSEFQKLVHHLRDAGNSTEIIEIQKQIGLRIDKKREKKEKLISGNWEKESEAKYQLKDQIELLVWLGKIDEVLFAIKDFYKRNPKIFLYEDDIYNRLLDDLISLGKVENALWLASLIHSKHTDNNFLNETKKKVEQYNVSFNLIKDGKLDEALKVVIKEAKKSERNALATFKNMLVNFVRAGGIKKAINFIEGYYSEITDLLTEMPNFVRVLAYSGYYDEACQLAGTSVDEFKEMGFTYIAGVLVGKDLDNKIIPVSEKLIPDIRKRCSYLVHIANGLLSIDPNRSKQLLENAIRMIERQKLPEKPWNDIKTSIAKELYKLGKYDEAFHILGESNTEFDSSLLWIKIIAGCAFEKEKAGDRIGKNELLTQAIKRIEKRGKKESAIYPHSQYLFENLANGLIDLGMIDDGLFVFEKKMDSTLENIPAFCNLIAKLASIGDKRTEKLIQNIIDIVNEVAPKKEGEQITIKELNELYDDLTEYGLFNTFIRDDFFSRGEVNFNKEMMVIAIEFFKNDQIDMALDFLKKATYGTIPEIIQSKIAVDLANNGKIEDALKISEGLSVISDIRLYQAEIIAGTGDTEQALAIIQDTTSTDHQFLDQVNGIIARVFAIQHNISRVYELLPTISKDKNKADYLKAIIAVELSRDNHLNKEKEISVTDRTLPAFDIIATIEDSTIRQFSEDIVSVWKNGGPLIDAGRKILEAKIVPAIRKLPRKENDDLKSILFNLSFEELDQANLLSVIYDSAMWFNAPPYANNTVKEILENLILEKKFDQAIQILEDLANSQMWSSVMDTVDKALGGMDNSEKLLFCQSTLRMARQKGYGITSSLVTHFIPIITSMADDITYSKDLLLQTNDKLKNLVFQEINE